MDIQRSIFFFSFFFILQPQSSTYLIYVAVTETHFFWVRWVCGWRTFTFVRFLCQAWNLPFDTDKKEEKRGKNINKIQVCGSFGKVFNEYLHAYIAEIYAFHAMRA